jgi:muramidase (phage lysozyme)
VSRLQGISPNLSAFLDMLAWSEIGPELLAESDDGYNILVGSTPEHPLLFDSYADHPNILNHQLNSTAAGRYQLLHRYWPPYKAELRLPDFSPASQDLVALKQIDEAGATADILAGDLASAIDKCAHLWASLPGAGYGQHENTLQNLQTAYTTAGGSCEIS